MRISRGLTLPVVVLSLSILSPILGEQTAQQIVQDANRLLAEGSYAEAARAYGDAIELEPSYSNYYKRATAYLSMGKQSSALEDFDTILKLNPAFTQAHLQKAKIYAKQGEFENAQSELASFAATKSDAAADELGQSINIALSERKNARHSAEKRQWEACVQHVTRALEIGPNSIELRELRLECSTEMGDLDSAYADLTRLAALRPSDVSLSLRLSQIAYFLLASPTASSHIKQCLHYDPESKACKKIHKLIRSLEKDTAKARNFVEGSSWRQAIKTLDGPEGLLARFEEALQIASTPQDGQSATLPSQFKPKESSQKRLELYALACKAAVGANDLKKDKGMKWCDEVLRLDENNLDALVAQGETLMKDEKWEDAVRMFESAFEKSGRSSQDILNRLQKAQRLLKVLKQKDYYKVLGVPRDADERMIKKAFRKAAKNAHPDVGGTEEQMAALNEAYEVLSDDELRQRYDNGDDPNDPSGGRGGNPFAHHGGAPFFFQQGGFGGSGGGFPFPGGQGGQQFHFKFGG